MPTTHPTTRNPGARAALAGAAAIGPFVAGLIPLGLTVGATAARADLPPLLGWASSATLYGASGQLALFEVVGSDGSTGMTLVATMAANLQMVLYSAAMRTHWVHEGLRWRTVAPMLLVSPLFAVATTHHKDEDDPSVRRRFYLGAGLTLWLAWLVLTDVGCLAGARVPEQPLLLVVTPLVLVAMAAKHISDTPTLVALVTGCTTAIAGSALPHGLGFVLGGLVGVAAGVAAEQRQPADEPSEGR